MVVDVVVQGMCMCIYECVNVRMCRRGEVVWGGEERREEERILRGKRGDEVKRGEEWRGEER